MKLCINIFLILLLTSCEEEHVSRMLWGNLKEVYNKNKEVQKPVNKMFDTFNYSKNVVIIRSRIDTLIDRQTKVWADVNDKHFFSDSLTQDLFSLKIVGDKDFNTIATFTIINANGKIIYADNFPLLDILGMAIDGGGYYATETRQEIFTQQYADNFFNSERFSVSFKPKEIFVPIDSLNEMMQIINVPQYAFNYQCNKNTKYQVRFNPNNKKVEKIKTH